jgi:hypothetical protein
MTTAITTKVDLDKSGLGQSMDKSERGLNKSGVGIFDNEGQVRDHDTDRVRELRNAKFQYMSESLEDPSL